MDCDLSISGLSYTQVKSLLDAAKEDFATFTESFIEEYAQKLSTYASFVTLRNEKGDITGIIAFYSNQKPTAYISHIWVAGCNRGGGACGKMIAMLSEYVKGKGFNAIKLEVRLNNRSAIRAYEKNGFKFISRNGESGYMIKSLSHNIC